MLDRKTPPRLTVDLTDSQAAGLGRIQWGMRKPLFHTIINQLNKAMDTADPGRLLERLSLANSIEGYIYESFCASTC